MGVPPRRDFDSGVTLTNVTKVVLSPSIDVITTPGGVYVWSKAPLVTCYTSAENPNEGVVVSIARIHKMHFGP